MNTKIPIKFSNKPLKNQTIRGHLTRNHSIILSLMRRKQQFFSELFPEPDIQITYDDQTGIKISHVYFKEFYGRIKYYEGANLILMQPNMFKSIFFQIHDKKITKITSYEKQFKLDSESYIIQMRSEDLILISKYYQLLQIVDINKQETLFKIKCRDSQKYQGFQYFKSQILFLINENEGQIKNFSMQRYKFTNQHKFKEFIFIEPRFSKYQINLESYQTIYILNSKTFKIINKQQKKQKINNLRSQIIVPDHFACKNIDLLEKPSIANLKDSLIIFYKIIPN